MSGLAECGVMEAVRNIANRVSDRIARAVVSQGLQQAVARPNTRDVYGALRQLLCAQPALSNNLSIHELRIFSQNGEDGVLAEILRRTSTGSCFFVEFGVEDGGECNTRLLADTLGWSGVYFETDAGDYERLRRRHAHNDRVVAIKDFVTPETVNALFAAASVPTDFDVLSIDIDGQDYYVWQALDGYQPRVVIIEYNSGKPTDSADVEPLGHRASFVDTFGASIGALVQLGAEKGYTLVYCDLAGVNAFFVRDDLASGFPPATMRMPNYLLSGFGHPAE